MFRIFNHHIAKSVLFLLAIESLILIASVYLVLSIYFLDPAKATTLSYASFQTQAGVFAFFMIFSMSVMGMYQLNYKEDFRHTLLNLMPAFLLGFGLLSFVFYLLPDIYFKSGILILAMLIAAFGIVLTRFTFYRWSEHSMPASRILVLGVGPLAKECSDITANNAGYHKLKVIGFVPTDDEKCVVPTSAVLPKEGSLANMAKKHGAREIVCAVENRRSGVFPIQELLGCKLNGILVSDLATFYERELSQIRIASLHPSWLVFGAGFNQGDLRTSIKRVFDLFASLILFAFTLPIMLVTAMLIYLEDGSPIFYRQERVGKNGRTFMVLKFRSMRNDAEHAGTPQWASVNDPRTTKVGHIIRKLRIDELPQIFNVLKGEMSFVGPRPERPYFVQQLSKDIRYYDARHTVKPGITGWAQVRYQYGASVEDAITKLQYDLYYVKNNSLFLDIMILLETIRVVLFGQGGR